MSVSILLGLLGPDIEDYEEESFLVFSQSIPSQNLGFVDSKATILDLTIVVWKITPLFARWVTAPTNLLFSLGILDSESTVLELGCGISGIIGLACGPLIGSYVLTDQHYVMKLVSQNLEENRQATSSTKKGRKSSSKSKRGAASASQVQAAGNIIATPLDWETDEVLPSLTGNESKRSFDAVIACDCIYNDALIKPLVQTCIDTCKLRSSDEAENEPAVCIIAQQLRSAEVFEEWLKEFHSAFRVWRLPDEMLIDGLKSDSGFVVHIGILRKCGYLSREHVLHHLRARVGKFNLQPRSSQAGDILSSVGILTGTILKYSRRNNLYSITEDTEAPSHIGRPSQSVLEIPRHPISVLPFSSK
ncbi:hypothetical protein LZ554_001896 [Drepanopeziza brunnea f. sp. 'monogermtubi']|nr:hypothetical protein LZ554_001896 [Drepanopeziza brunnea f. sp. 'monogermtubi']